MCTLGYSPVCQNKSQQGRLGSLTKHPPSLIHPLCRLAGPHLWQLHSERWEQLAPSTCKPSLGWYGSLMSCQVSQEHFRKKEIYVNVICFVNLNTIITYWNVCDFHRQVGGKKSFLLSFWLSIRSKRAAWSEFQSAQCQCYVHLALECCLWFSLGCRFFFSGEFFFLIVSIFQAW